MPDATNMGTISKGVTDLARDAAYVAVGLGVLGYQRAQVQRNELKSLLSKDFSLDQHLERRAHGADQGSSSSSTTCWRPPRSSSRPAFSRWSSSSPRRSPS